MQSRHASSLLFASFVLVALLAATPAAAAEPAEQPAAEDTSKHLSGLEVAVRPSVGGAGSGSPLVVDPGARVVGEIPSVLKGATPYGSALGAGAMLGFRFHPLVSAGLRGDFGSISSSGADGVRDLSRNWQSAGLYVRAYPLAWHEGVRKYVDPYIATGVTYVHDGQAFKSDAATNVGTRVEADWQLDSHSIGVPLAIGVDYRVTKALSLGPSFEYVIMNPIAGCAKMSAAGFQTNRMCTDNDASQKTLVAQALGAWNVGLSIRLTPF